MLSLYETWVSFNEQKIILFFFAESDLPVKCVCNIQTSPPLQRGAESYEGDRWYCHQVDHSQVSHITIQNLGFLI